VTGSSSGFGVLIARTLARAGYDVFASMRAVGTGNAEIAASLSSWATSEGLRLRVIEMDVSQDASVQAAVSKVLERSGHLDVVVNNAGIAAAGPIEAFEIDQMKELFDTNVWGPIRVDKAVLPHMRSRRSGLLIHISSTLGRILPNTGGLYPASKWAVEGLAESLHYQLAPFNIDVSILEPGSFPTPAVSRALRPLRGDIEAEYAALPPRTRRAREVAPDYMPPDPQEVADAVLQLIEIPDGQRPLRMVVGPVFTVGVAEFNEVYERARDALAASLLQPDQAITWGGRRVTPKQ
jgi:NAD(P)-dependent dehydrogenase (short-subunit alcohol dehydrogenase family)